MTGIPVITIDGPSGVGKGTLARLLARKLGWHLLDSGALYRLTAMSAQHAGVRLDDEPAVAEVAATLPVVFREEGPDFTRILLDGDDVTMAIRTETMGNAASRVAVLGRVREALLGRQRAFRMAPGLVADGRDMGTVVFPDAAMKFFLTATADERGRRRYKQLKQQGIDASLRALVADILERDVRDAARTVAPLRPADDAQVIDTTHLSVPQVMDEVLARLEHAMPVIFPSQ